MLKQLDIKLEDYWFGYDEYYVFYDDEHVPINDVQREHFIQTVDAHGGFNEADFFTFEKLYMRDLGHGGSFWDCQQKDYRKEIIE